MHFERWNLQVAGVVRVIECFAGQNLPRKGGRRRQAMAGQARSAEGLVFSRLLCFLAAIPLDPRVSPCRRLLSTSEYPRIPTMSLLNGALKRMVSWAAKISGLQQWHISGSGRTQTPKPLPRCGLGMKERVGILIRNGLRFRRMGNEFLSSQVTLPSELVEDLRRQNPWWAGRACLLSVAQTSKSAVSRVSKPGNGNAVEPTWKSAIQQVGKPALRSIGRFALNRFGRAARRLAHCVLQHAEEGRQHRALAANLFGHPRLRRLGKNFSFCRKI